ncbi:MAG TPA: PadR family transcriptional regulator [Micromonosporaceae bacterium]|jgi:DNA-binding PadR family transcriptional regulator
MSRRRVNNPLALAVLSCLAERPMHPYEISSTLRERGKEQSIKLNYGSLYSVVEALQRHRLIEARETERAGKRPERTVYAITQAGIDEFEDWLAELLSTPVKEYLSLEAGLALMPGLPPDVVARLLGIRADRLKVELGAVDAMHEQARAQGLVDLFLVESLYRRHMLAAELAFIEKLVADLRSGAFPGVKAWARVHELRAEGLSMEEIFADPVRHLGEEGRALVPRE